MFLTSVAGNDGGIVMESKAWRGGMAVEAKSEIGMGGNYEEAFYVYSIDLDGNRNLEFVYRIGNGLPKKELY